MKKNWKQALAVLLTALLVVGAAPAAGLAGIADVLSVTAAAENSGTYGVLTYQIADGEASITGCDQSASGALIIPDTIEGCPVTSIGESAVRECVNLSSITIPNSVIIIEQEAFFGCDRLLEIVIPDSVTTIGHWAFRGCGSLTRLSIGKGLSVLGLDGFGNGGNVPFEARGVFGECPLTEIHVAPENRYFHSIDNCLIMDVPFDVVYDDVDHDYFYEQTSNGTGVLLLIPFGTSVIPYDGSFGHIACDDICMSMNMTEFVIPEGIQSIDGRVFMYSWGLQSITIPRSLKYIDYNNFMELQNLPDDMREQLQAAYDEAVAAGESMIWDELPIEAVQNVLNGTYLKDVYYQGSQAEWDKIIIDDGNNGLLNATIHFLGDVPPCEHDYISVVTTEPTYTAEGVRTYTCTKCGDSYTESIAPYNILSYTIADGEASITGCDKAVNGAVIIPGTIEGCPVTSIDEFAFGACSNLTNITIPDSVTSIGDGAFIATSLTAINVDENNPAFCSDANGVLYNKGKTRLVQYPAGNPRTSFTIPDGVTSIGDGAFQVCFSLTGVTIPDSVITIGSGAFWGCTSLASVTIPNSVTSISECAFVYCFSLASVTIPDSVTDIDGSAFVYCVSLASVTIPNSVTSIGDYAFLMHLDPDTLEKLRQEYDAALLAGETQIDGIPLDAAKTFLDHPDGSLTDVYFTGTRAEWDAIEIGANNEDLLNAAIRFLGDVPPCEHDYISVVTTEPTYTAEGVRTYTCTKCGNNYTESIAPYNILSYTITDGKATITGCDKAVNGAVIIPGTIEGCPVTCIGFGAFQTCTNLTSVMIPDSVIEIGISAFRYCTNLVNVTIPNSVTAIHLGAFGHCYSLTNITIPDSVTCIDEAFHNCKKIVSFTVSNANRNYSSDEYGALYNKDKTVLIQYPCGNPRTSFSIPDSVENIDASAFLLSVNLERVTIPDSVTTIGSFAFEGCFRLASVTIPDGVTCIDNYAFCECMSLASVTIPDGVTNIGNYAFAYCLSLASVTIPNSVTSIGDHAFLLHNTNPDILEENQQMYDAALLAGETQIDGIPLDAVKTFLDHPNGSLTDVYFKGTRAQWDAIEIDEENDDLLNATIHFLDDNATLQVHGDTAVRGQTVQVRVSIDDNPGLIALRMHLQYDPQALTLTAVDNGEVFGASCFNPGGDLANVPFTTLWVDPLSTQNYDTNGTLVTFTFTVAEDAPVGDTPITLEVDAPSTFNMDLQAVGCTVTNGCVHVLSHLPGDADGDGEVTLMDVTAISRFLAGGWDVTINEAAADVNGDAVVDLRDVILIRRFLAGGWDVELI